MESPARHRRIQVQLDAARARMAGKIDEPGGRIDIAGGTDRHEKISRHQRRFDPVHMVRHLAEPDDVRPHVAGKAAGRAGGGIQQAFRPGMPAVAGQAPGGFQFAMHVQHPPRTRPVMQVIDILRDQEKFARPFGIEAGKRAMCGVGFHTAQRRTARIIEALHQHGIPAEGLRRRDIFHPMPFPQPVRAAEGRHARFRRNPGACQDHDAPGRHGQRARAISKPAPAPRRTPPERR